MAARPLSPSYQAPPRQPSPPVYPAPPGYAAPPAPVAAALPPAVELSIPRVGVWAFTRIGMAVGAAFAIVPCLLIALVGSSFVHWLRTLFDGWTHQQVGVPIVGQFINVRPLEFNFVELLGLEGAHSVLRYWDDRLALLFGLLWLLPWVAFILSAGLFAMILALVYNGFARVGGGIEVEVTRRR